MDAPDIIVMTLDMQTNNDQIWYIKIWTNWNNTVS